MVYIRPTAFSLFRPLCAVVAIPVPRIVREIDCVCRLLDGGNMIQYDACNQWFHDVCIETNTRAWENLDSVWLCITCL